MEYELLRYLECDDSSNMSRLKWEWSGYKSERWQTESVDSSNYRSEWDKDDSLSSEEREMSRDKGDIEDGDGD